jgi:hypothetical protein
MVSAYLDEFFLDRVKNGRKRFYGCLLGSMGLVELDSLFSCHVLLCLYCGSEVVSDAASKCSKRYQA